jgi:hypothetical protein
LQREQRDVQAPAARSPPPARGCGGGGGGGRGGGGSAGGGGGAGRVAEAGQGLEPLQVLGLPNEEGGRGGGVVI